MFRGVKNGLELIKASVSALKKYPLMLIPMLLCWLLYAPIVVAAKYYIPWGSFTLPMQIAVAFALVLGLTTAFSLSAFILLELIHQIEMGRRPALTAALRQGLDDLFRAFPIVLIWALAWFTLSVIAAIFRKGGQHGDAQATPENIAKTLGGGENISLAGGIIQALKKGVRMTVFIIYPALAWEEMGTSKAVRKGLSIAKSHLSEFATGFMLTELAALVVFTPPAILFLLSDLPGVDFPDLVWFTTILYCAFAFSFTLFLEQIFTAELYLWHLILEKATEDAEKAGHPTPTLATVKRPTLLDNVPDMLLTRVR